MPKPEPKPSGYGEFIEPLRPVNKSLDTVVFSGDEIQVLHHGIPAGMIKRDSSGRRVFEPRGRIQMSAETVQELFAIMSELK